MAQPTKSVRVSQLGTGKNRNWSMEPPKLLDENMISHKYHIVLSLFSKGGYGWQ